MSMIKGGLLAAYESLVEIVEIQSKIIDSLFLSVSSLNAVTDEELAMIDKAAKMRATAEDKGYLWPEGE